MTGGPNQFGLVIPALDYWIPIKNIWILDFRRFALDRRIQKASP
jgi:hypothetical protein